MTATHNAGPQITYGAAGPGPGQTSGSGSDGANPEAGPSVTYQGDAILDVRFPYRTGITGVGKVRGFLDTPYVLTVDVVPQTKGTAVIAALANVTSGTPMTLVSTQSAGIAPLFKIIPFGLAQQAANQVTVTAIQPGWTIGSITAGAKAVTSSVTTRMVVGMPIFIAGAGAAGAPLFTTVAAIGSATAFTTADAAITTVSGTCIGTASDSLLGPDPYVTYGAGRLFDPTQGVARAVSVTGSASATGGNITIAGYDIFGIPMTETIAAPASATTVNGVKAFKYITSVTPAFTDAHNYSIGTTDIFGIHLRSDAFEYANIYFNGSFITASTGWTAGVTTSPATATTGDVRGTYAVQSASDGSKRLAIFTSQPLWNLASATPTNPVPLFGVAQF